MVLLCFLCLFFGFASGQLVVLPAQGGLGHLETRRLFLEQRWEAGVGETLAFVSLELTSTRDLAKSENESAKR